MFRTVSFYFMAAFCMLWSAPDGRYLFQGSDGRQDRFLDTKTGQVLLRDVSPDQVQRHVVETPWLQCRRQGDILYFLYSEPAHIKRYDVASAAWLTDLVLAETPTAFAVTESQLFVAFDRRISRFGLDGAGETHLRNTTNTVHGLTPFRNFLIYQYGGAMASMDATTGAAVDESGFWYSMGALVIRPDGVGFGRSRWVSPSDIVRFEMGRDGTFIRQNDSPNHGDYPGASTVHILPDQARVVDNAGIIYHADSLTYANSFGGGFDDIQFYGDLPVVLRDNVLIAFSNTFLETGRFEPTQTVLKIAVQGEAVLAFYQDGENLAVAQYDIELLEPDQPGEPVDPNGLVYTPDDAYLGNDGIVYLLSRSFLSVFRWSIDEQRYLETIPLANQPSYMTYSPAADSLFFAYASGAITKMGLGDTATETAFANLPTAPLGLSIADQFVFAADSSGAWESHRLFNANGVLVEAKDWNHYSREYVWSQPLRKMFFFRDSSSPNDLHFEEISTQGQIVAEGETPYHSSAGIRLPIRVSPDGAYVVLGSGYIYDTETMNQDNALSNTFSDAAWLNGRLFTLRSVEEGSELQEWGAGNFPVVDRVAVQGEPLRLFSTSDALLVITQVNGVPLFSLRQSQCADSEPELGTLPAEQEVCVGSLFTLQLPVLAGSVDSWQWRRNGVPIAGAVSETFTGVIGDEGDFGDYDCIVTNCAGSFVSSATTMTQGRLTYDDTFFGDWMGDPRTGCIDTNQNAVVDVLDLVAMVNAAGRTKD